MKKNLKMALIAMVPWGPPPMPIGRGGRGEIRSGYRKIEILVPANRVKDFLAVLRNERTLVIATKSDIDHLKEIYGNAGTVQNHKSKTEREGEAPWS